MTQVFLKLFTPKDVFTYIHKSCCFWKLFDSERVNESLKPLKSAEKYFYPTFFISLGQLALEKVILSQIRDFRTACEHLDCRLLVFS